MSGVTDSAISVYDQYWEEDIVPPYLDSLFPVFEQLGILPDTRVLDIGCGNGVLGEFLSRKYGCRMYGIDISPVALKAAEARGYKVKLADPDSRKSFHHLFPEVRFDVVVLSAVLEHIHDPAALLAQAYAALKDGGTVVVLTPNITWFLNRILFALNMWEHPLMGGTPGHIRYLNQQMLQDLLIEAGFQELDWSYSPMAVLPPGQDLHVRNRRVPFVRRLVGKRARRWPALLAENFIVLGRKPIATSDVTRWAQLKPANRVEGLKVLHIAATAYGAHWMFEILRGLHIRGYDVAALISGTQGDLAAKLEQANIPYHVGDFNVFSERDLISIARKIFKLVSFLRKHCFDIVHYHLFASVILGRAAAWIADVPLRLSMITGPFYLEAPASRELDRRTLWMDNKIIASCNYTRQLYHKTGVRRKKIGLIFYGADETRFDPATADSQKLRREFGISSEEPIVGMVAYFYAPLPKGPWTPSHLQGQAVKGHEFLLQAAKIVLKKNPKVKFLLVGKGWDTEGERYERDLKGLAKRMGLDRSVIFTGARSDIQDLLASFDVSVQCSLSENLGGTIESLLMARPTVATAVGGMVDSVRHEQTGLLVPPYDPRRLAEAILEMLDNPERAQNLAQNGRQLMLKEFTLAKTVDDIDRLYQLSARKILKRKRCGSTSLSAYYYRVYRSWFHSLILAFYWIGVPRGIVVLIGRKIALIARKPLTLLKHPKSLVCVLVDLAPLLLPFLVLVFLLPPLWKIVLFAGGIVAFVLFRNIFVGPTMVLLRLLTKRLFDTIIATFLIIVTLPVWLVIVLAVRLGSSSPVLSRQRRAGRFGRPFTMLRFRTMKSRTAQFTRIGKVLCRLCLDGLPQLINIVRGEMSLVGPRPVSPTQAEQLTTHQRRRLEVKPGIVSWAERHDRKYLSWDDQIEFDIWYVDHWSFWVDLYTLFRAFCYSLVVKLRECWKKGNKLLFFARRITSCPEIEED